MAMAEPATILTVLFAPSIVLVQPEQGASGPSLPSLPLYHSMLHSSALHAHWPVHLSITQTHTLAPHLEEFSVVDILGEVGKPVKSGIHFTPDSWDPTE